MDEELALLQQELAQVQEEDALQRLSERNVVQLVIKLMEQESVDVRMTVLEFLTFFNPLCSSYTHSPGRNISPGSKLKRRSWTRSMPTEDACDWTSSRPASKLT